MNKNNITFDVLEKIEQANYDFSLFDGCKRMLIGLSGGADSTCLLLTLKALSQKYGFELFALHVNHMIRGKEADRDMEFACSLCEKNAVTFHCEKVDVPALAEKNGVSLELAARDARYSAFKSFAVQNNISHVAVAHNACDNAETVLFNLVRGTSAKGLCGIPPKRDLSDGIFIIRPLIYLERQEIEEYLGKLNQGFMTDSTNLCCDYSRNHIRNNVIPLLKKLNPSLEKSFSRTSKLIKQDCDCLNRLAQNSFSNKTEQLCRLDKAILSRVIVLMFEKVSNEMPEQVHIDALMGKIYAYEKSKENFSISFPDSKRACVDNGVLFFTEDTREKSPLIQYSFELKEGFNIIEGTDFALYISFDSKGNFQETITQTNKNIYKKYTSDYLYFDKIPDSLFIRNKRNGDKIISSKISKRLKRIMNEQKLSQCDRDLLPLICDDDEILLIPGICVCDKARDTQKPVKIKAELFKK